MTDSGKTHTTGPFDAEDMPSELLRAARLCHPDWETAGRLTFRPPVPSWTTWRDSVFLPALHPAFVTAYSAFALGHRRELAQNDAALDTSLPAALAEASRRAGRLLLAEYTVPNAEKLWTVYRDRVLAGEAPGHFAVALAIRAAAFYLPLPLAISTLLFLEARGGNPEALSAEWTEMIAAAQPRDGAAQLRAA
jgi:hypothetical protein